MTAFAPRPGQATIEDFTEVATYEDRIAKGNNHFQAEASSLMVDTRLESKLSSRAQTSRESTWTKQTNAILWFASETHGDEQRPNQ